MAKASETPILIVGGGAAGTVLSLELARRGVGHRVVDRLAGPAPTSRAITVHARTAEMLDRIDQSLIDRFLERGIHNKGYILHFVDEAGGRSEVRPGIDFTTIDSRYPYVLIHRQDETEAFIRDYLAAEYDRDPEWNTQLMDVRQDGEEVVALLHHRDGGEDEEVRCRYLVACDGLKSRVREALDLTQKGSDYKGTVLQNLDVFLEGFPDVDDYTHYCAGTDHFLMVAKLPGGFYRLLLSDRGEAADPDVTPEEGFKRLLDKHFDGVRFGDTVWHSKWESWVRLADTYRVGNVFLAGDSAHVHSTTGGQGMNCCMQDAFNLGWKLAMVESGLAKPALLDSYEVERRPIAEQVIWAASSLHDIFMGHGQDIQERRQRISDPDFLNAVVGRCSGISYTYRDSGPEPRGLTPIDGPAVGDRAPDADLDTGGRLFELARHPGFTLIAISGEDAPDAEAAMGRLTARFGQVLRAETVTPTPDLERSYGHDHRTRLFLIRPDGYVGYRCLLHEAKRLEAHLGGLLTL